MIRLIRRWLALQRVKDCDACIDHYRRQLAALPEAIRREEALRRQHVGRAATLAERRDPVNWNLGRIRPQPKGVTQ